MIGPGIDIAVDVQNKLERILEVLDMMKAEEVITIDVSGRTIIADVFLVATATSSPHAKAIANELTVRLKGDGERPHHWETDPGYIWTVIDYGDVILHLFQEPARTHYNLEALWGARRAPRPPPPPPPRRLPLRRPVRRWSSSGDDTSPGGGGGRDRGVGVCRGFTPPASQTGVRRLETGGR